MEPKKGKSWEDKKLTISDMITFQISDTYFCNYAEIIQVY
jgi:hypothetical protein